MPRWGGVDDDVGVRPEQDSQPQQGGQLVHSRNREVDEARNVGGIEVGAPFEERQEGTAVRFEEAAALEVGVHLQGGEARNARDGARVRPHGDGEGITEGVGRIHRDDDDLLPMVGEGHSECGGRRRFAHSTLAADEDQPGRAKGEGLTITRLHPPSRS